MAKELARISGPITLIDVRSGTSARTGKDYRIVEATILVEQMSTSTVSLSDRITEAGMPGEGQLVDYLCEVSVYGNAVQFRAIRDMSAVPAKVTTPSRVAAPASA